MHILIIVIVIAVVIAIWLTRQRSSIEVTNLSSLKLREFVDAIEAPSAASEEQVLVWSLCFVDSNPELNLPKIIKFLGQKWNIKAETIPGDYNIQRVITFGETRLTFEPIAVSPGAVLPDQIIPGKPACAPNDAIGCILVTASTPGGGAAASLGLSQAVLALVDTCRQVSDVYWMSSEELSRRDSVRKKLNRNYKNLDWPVDLWVSSHTFNENGKVIGYTVGLSKIGGTDFEALNAHESSHSLSERLNGAARYVVNHFGQIQNGDTMGVDAKEQIRLTKAPSQTIHKGWVFQLQYERSINE